MSIRDCASGIQHLGIPTKNMEKSLDFYEKLGFETVFSAMNGTKRVNFVRLGDLTIELYESRNAALCYGAIEHAAINVRDIQEAYDLICAGGLNTLDDTIHFLPFWDNGVKYFTIEGPNREKIEFSQYL